MKFIILLFALFFVPIFWSLVDYVHYLVIILSLYCHYLIVFIIWSFSDALHCIVIICFFSLSGQYSINYIMLSLFDYVHYLVSILSFIVSKTLFDSFHYVVTFWFFALYGQKWFFAWFWHYSILFYLVIICHYLIIFINWECSISCTMLSLFDSFHYLVIIVWFSLSGQYIVIILSLFDYVHYLVVIWSLFCHYLVII